MTAGVAEPLSLPADVGRAPQAVGFAGALAVWLSAPFEATQPILRLPGQSLSSTEIVVLLAIAAWVAAVLVSGTRPRVRTGLTAAALALIGALSASALVAPLYRANALHMVGRLLLASALCLMTVNGVRSLAHARRLMLCACAVGGVAAVLVVLDYTRVAPVQDLLAPFRTQTAMVGAQVRASGSFQYPTIASMFLEITFACGAALVPWAIDRRRRMLAVGLLAALVVTAAAITFTYARAGIITTMTTLAIVGGWRVWRAGADRGAGAILALAVVSGAMLPLSRTTEAVRLRMSTEHLDRWYRATIAAPPRVSIDAGARIPVPITLTNTGQVTWDPSAPQPFGVSYHWLLADSDRVVSWEGIRASFPEPVAPGGRVTVTLLLEAPREPGQYRVLWDLYQENLLWFSTEPGASLTFSTAVVGGLGREPTLDRARLPPMPKPATRPGRLQLWSAAARMVGERPWLGVGADNFRLLYGPYAGLPRPDPRVHTNNMYVELVVGGGLLAAVALAWLVGSVSRLVWWAVHRAEGPEGAAVASGVVAAATAIALHGMVDSFLSFTATYAVIGITMGLLVATHDPGQGHAHRV